MAPTTNMSAYKITLCKQAVRIAFLGTESKSYPYIVSTQTVFYVYMSASQLPKYY